MNLNLITEQANGAWAQVRDFLAASPEIAAAGLAMAVLAGAVIAVMALVTLVRAVASMRRAAMAATIRNMRDAGVRVVVARGADGRTNTISRFLRKSMETHLADFMFGGPFKVIPYPGAVRSEIEARRLIARSEADLLLWSERPRGGKARAMILSRSPNAFEASRPPAILAMPKERTAWNDGLSRAMAYAAARQFRPALGRPQDFRAERLMPVVEKLIGILDQKPKADERLLAEMVDDTSAGALQLALAGDDAWLDRAVDIATTTLAEINRGAAPDRWIASKITLGRALRLKAEKRFDPVVLRESIAHLTEALDALRAEPRFRLAESAAHGIGEAQKLLGGRRKFSISGGGI